MLFVGIETVQVFNLVNSQQARPQSTCLKEVFGLVEKKMEQTLE
jgi:hypothetical protein